MKFANLSSACKRARRFALPFDGPFSALGCDGPIIAARNYSHALDGCESFLDELCVLDSWAESINRFCDSHLIADDDDAKLAFSSFLSRLWLDPRVLA